MKSERENLGLTKAQFKVLKRIVARAKKSPITIARGEAKFVLDAIFATMLKLERHREKK